VDNIVEEILSDDNKCALWILLLQAGAVLLASPWVPDRHQGV
jgi:hypothetical protein